jgi:hypothetical protein
VRGSSLVLVLVVVLVLESLEASETPLGTASDSPPCAIQPKQVLRFDLLGLIGVLC